MDNVENKKPETSPPSSSSTKLIVLIVLIVVLMVLYFAVAKPALNKLENNPITQQLMAEKQLILDLDTLTKSQIEQRAQALDASEVISDPTGLMGQYVTITGTLSSEESSAVEANIARNYFGEGKMKGYVLNNSIVLIDITGEGKDYADGTTLRGYGVVFLLHIKDIWDLPVVGPDLQREFDNVEGMNPEAIFFISKGVDEVDMVEETAIDDNPCGDNPCEMNPCGDNPCGENPCAENPCVDNPCGENPCGDNPCGDNPCGDNPCGENPCGENPCG